jgi:uncharacterized protein YjdB
VDGGFDPIAIPVVAGDTIDVTVTRASGGIAYAFTTVAVRKPPRIVRTQPPHGQTDVPVSLKAVVIFSEPVDPSTVTSSSLQLRVGGVLVPATVRVLPESDFTVEVAPDAPLVSSTAYTLTIAQSVTDLTGDPLATATIVSFTTGVAPTLPSPVNSVFLEPTLDLVAGATVQLIPILQDANFNVLTGRTTTWSSSDTTIVSISPTGMLRAIAAGGPVTITAVCEGKMGTERVTVAPVPASFLTVRTVTTGVDVDSDGYIAGFDFDDSEQSHHVGINTSTTFGPFSATQTATVWLADLDPNCAATDDYRSISLPQGSTTTITFSVTCGPRAALNDDPVAGVWDVTKWEFFRDSALTSRIEDLARPGAYRLILSRPMDGRFRWEWQFRPNPSVPDFVGISGGVATLTEGIVRAILVDRETPPEVCSYFRACVPFCAQQTFVRTGSDLVITVPEPPSGVAQPSGPDVLSCTSNWPRYFSWSRLTLRKVR